MQVLITGANGFIGSHVTGTLLEAGHGVTAAVRAPEAMRARFPSVQTIACDLNRDLDPASWIERLRGIDAVVNCAGILRGGFRQNARRIHIQAPMALFEACRRTGVRRVAHVSAVSASIGAETAYARTKLEAEQKLMALDLDWIILRPSLVYAAGSYGGTSLLRALAALPFLLPIPGTGGQAFRPIHARDLAAGLVRLLERPEVSCVTLEPAGPQIITLHKLLVNLRAWLALPAAREIHIPLCFIRALARLGDLCAAPTFNTTAVRQLEFGNTGNPDEFVRLSGVTPASLARWQLRQPSHVQDRWHARLYWLAPCLRFALAILWIVSGIAGLLAGCTPPIGTFHSTEISSAFPGILVLAFSALDIAVGLALLVRWKPQILAAVQLLIVAGYTVALSIVAPWLWLAPLGPLLKNLPIFAAIATWMVTENRR